MKKARSTSFRLSDDQAAKVRWLIHKQGKCQHDIAALLGVNQGRISEFMAGKRTYLMVQRELPY